MPRTPCGKKPPCAVKFCKPTPDDAGAPYTNTAPSRMNARIATIFSMENAYSITPYTLTLAAFTTISAPENPTIQYQPGTFANQYFMNTATALTSVPTANTTADQYAYRTRKPASGPI